MSGIFCPLTILESKVLSRNITLYWRKNCRQLSRKKEKSWNSVRLEHRSAEVLRLSRLFSVCPQSLLPSLTANGVCQLHHRCAHITVLWLANDMAVQPNSCWDPDHHVPTTIKKNTRVKPKHPNPAAFRGALNISQWDEREIVKYLYLQVIIYSIAMNYAQGPNPI